MLSLFFKKDSSLWQSDGTEANTTEVKSNLGLIKGILEVNSKLLIFSYNTTTQKQTIWNSDGTETGVTVNAGTGFNGQV